LSYMGFKTGNRKMKETIRSNGFYSEKSHELRRSHQIFRFLNHGMQVSQRGNAMGNAGKLQTYLNSV